MTRPAGDVCMETKRQCANCGKEEGKEGAALKKCARCQEENAALYCSRACQKEHWNRIHREVCTKVFEVCETEKGVGLRAGRQFSAGDVLFSEKPVLVHPRRVLITDVELEREIRSAEFDNLSVVLQRSVRELFDKNAARAGTEKTLDGIWETNAVALRETGDSGLFLKFSRLNHSCRPNVRHTWRNDKKKEFIIATRDISPGDELLTCYIKEDDVFDITTARQMVLRENFGFDCKCELCERDGISAISEGNQRMREIGSLHRSIPMVAQSNPRRALQMVDTCLKLFRLQGLDMAFLEYMLLNDGIQIAMIGLHDRQTAIQYARRAVDAAKIAFGNDSPDVAKSSDIVRHLRQR